MYAICISVHNMEKVCIVCVCVLYLCMYTNTYVQHKLMPIYSRFNTFLNVVQGDNM